MSLEVVPAGSVKRGEIVKEGKGRDVADYQIRSKPQVSHNED